MSDTSHRFRALLAFAAGIVALPMEPECAIAGFLNHAPKNVLSLGMDRQHRLREKSSAMFVADLSHPTDGVTVRQTNIRRA